MTDLSEKMRARLGAGEAMTIADLVHEFGASERTVRRAVADLLDRGVMEWSYDGRRKVWKMKPDTGLRDVGLSLAEATALRMALRSYGAFWEQFEAAGFGEALESVMKKLDDHFFPQVRARVFEKTLRPLVDAIIAQEALAATHVDVERGALFKLDPYAVVLKEAAVKVEGLVSVRDELVTLTVEGFTSIQRLKGASFQRPKRRSKGVVELEKRIGPRLQELIEEPEEEHESTTGEKKLELLVVPE